MNTYTVVIRERPGLFSSRSRDIRYLYGATSRKRARQGARANHPDCPILRVELVRAKRKGRHFKRIRFEAEYEAHLADEAATAAALAAQEPYGPDDQVDRNGIVW